MRELNVLQHSTQLSWATAHDWSNVPLHTMSQSCGYVAALASLQQHTYDHCNARSAAFLMGKLYNLLKEHTIQKGMQIGILSL